MECYGKWCVINGKGRGRKESCPNLSSTSELPGGTEENRENFNGGPFLGKDVCVLGTSRIRSGRNTFWSFSVNLSVMIIHVVIFNLFIRSVGQQA